MLGIVRYSHLSAKISAMRGKLLSQEDYEQLMRKTSVTEIAVYLRDYTNYTGVFKQLQDVEIHRGYLEVLLYRAQLMDALKIGKYLRGSDQSIYRYVYRKQEIEDLKKMLRILQMGIPLDTIDRKTLFISKYSKIDFNYSLRAKNITELIDTLRNTKFYYTLKPLILGVNEIDIYAAEMALDMYYYIKLVEQLKSTIGTHASETVQALFGADADLKNILWLYRVKKYYKVNKEMIYRYMIPLSYKLTKQDLEKLIETKNEEELILAVGETYYGKYISNDPQKWEREMMVLLMDMQRKSTRLFPYSIAPIVGYIALKELEIRNVIMIIEGVRYKVNPELMSKQVIL